MYRELAATKPPPGRLVRLSWRPHFPVSTVYAAIPYAARQFCSALHRKAEEFPVPRRLTSSRLRWASNGPNVPR